ncbi:MAG: prephenate dehydrogenase/arogenate dehydrogenase family protein, partial [Vicinamibacterales bacterium]|nr:prephenate dehydrogenase/arogenate dehydrogenase family protein [Vicinamibacterales bacterium]
MTDRKPLPVISAGAIGAAPVFEKIGIVGLGLIGGSIAMASRAAWPNALIIGVDTGELLEEAMVLHAVDVGADDVVVLSEADLVILAAPVRQNLEMLDEVAAHVGGEAVVTDVGSTKRAIVEAARGLPPRLRFVGGHPLAGAPRQGIRHARADLFTGRPWLLTPDGDAHGEALL